MSDLDPPEYSALTGGEGHPPLTTAFVSEWFMSSGVIEGAIRQGEMIPDFELANGAGDGVSIQTLLDRGPVVITFTLGRFSPFCRRSLLDLQAGLAEIGSLGTSVVAVTPDHPAASRALGLDLGLGFDLLADEGGRLAALFGIAYAPPVAIAHWLALIGLDEPRQWRARDIPLPATFVVTPDGIARMAFVPSDPQVRISRSQVVAALSALPPSTPAAGG